MARGMPRAATVATAIVLTALGLGILVASHDVPGFEAPGAPVTMHAMKAMGWSRTTVRQASCR